VDQPRNGLPARNLEDLQAVASRRFSGDGHMKILVPHPTNAKNAPVEWGTRILVFTQMKNPPSGGF
jgi:hypothetical protein